MSTIIRNCQRNDGKSMIALDGEDRIWDCPGRGCPCEGAKARKPTPRMLYLMGLAERGGIYGSVWTYPSGAVHHSFHNIHCVGYADQSRRNPSNREILAMLATGWFEMRRTGQNTTDTRTGKVSAWGNKMWLTPAGIGVLHVSRPNRE